MFLCRVALPSALVLAVLGLGSIVAQEPEAKLAVPAEAAQAEALKLAKEVYGDEFTKAKTTSQKKALAEKMLEKASGSKEDRAAHFILLRLARDIAASAGEVDVALRAVDDLTAVYPIDGYPMKRDVILTAAKEAGVAKQQTAVVEAAMQLMDEAVAKDDFDTARTLREAASASARKANDAAAIRKVAARRKELEAMAKEYTEVKRDFAALEAKPADPEANAAVGKYLCLMKGDWEKGVPMLALGSDPQLKAVAAKELEGAKSSEEQVKLGDQWWELAEAHDGAVQKRLRGRAGYWYKTALPFLTGLSRDKVEKRLKETVDDPSQPPATRSPRPNKDGLADRRFLVGQWDCGDVLITLRADSTALKNRNNPLGRWECVNGEARIVWNDGARTVLQRYGQGFRKASWPAGASPDSPPKFVFPAVKR